MTFWLRYTVKSLKTDTNGTTRNICFKIFLKQLWPIKCFCKIVKKIFRFIEIVHVIKFKVNGKCLKMPEFFRLCRKKYVGNLVRKCLNIFGWSLWETFYIVIISGLFHTATQPVLSGRNMCITIYYWLIYNTAPKNHNNVLSIWYQIITFISVRTPNRYRSRE